MEISVCRRHGGGLGRQVAQVKLELAEKWPNINNSHLIHSQVI